MPRVRVATPSPLEIALAQGRVGATVLSPGAAGIAIWHNFGASETYSIVQTDSFFGVDIATGLVTVAEELSANTPYEFMLELKDGTFTATREFRFTTGQVEKGKLVSFGISAVPRVRRLRLWDGVRSVERIVTLFRARREAKPANTSQNTKAPGKRWMNAHCREALWRGNCNALADWLVFTEDDLTLGSVYYYRLDSCGDLGCAESDILSFVRVAAAAPDFQCRARRKSGHRVGDSFARRIFAGGDFRVGCSLDFQGCGGALHRRIERVGEYR